MNSSGISRRIDELGRIVIPVEIRRELNIREGETLEFNIKEDSIILRKKSYIESDMTFLCGIGETLNSVVNGDYFITDREKIIISSNKDLENTKLNEELSGLITIHDLSVINSKSLVDSLIYVYPYYSQNKIIGLICLYNIDNIDRYHKLINFASNYRSN